MALEEEIISQFYKALEEMSPQQREIILMTLRGDRVDDISRKLNISPNSVKLKKRGPTLFCGTNSGAVL